MSTPTSTGASQYQSYGNTTFSATVTGLTNGTTYCFHVTATNSAGQSAPGTKLGTPHGLAQVVKTVTGNGGVSQPIYAYGQTVTYTVTVTNPETAGTMNGMQFSDAVPEAMTLVPGAVWLNGALCAATTCPLTGNTFDFTLPNLAAGQSATIVYQATIPNNELLQCIAALVNSATVTNAAGPATATATVNACNSGLGLEKWWSYAAATQVGPHATASVNVANGNLVLQATDATPVQGHGRLALVVRRTYNSREATLATLPGSLGAGWQLNIGQSSDLAADGVGVTGLYVPTADSILAPLSVGLVDRDGTRHVFTPNSVGVNVFGTGVSTALRPKKLVLETGYTTLCIDQTYDAPQGVHLGLWRYVETTQSSCSGLTNANSKLLGFAAERPDRIRYEWAATGQLLSMLDGAGNRLDYVYDNVPTGVQTGLLAGISLNLGNLRAVYDPNACTATATPVTIDAIPSMCRAIRIYHPSATEMVVYDGATRQNDWENTEHPVIGRGPTRYYFDTPATGQPKHLIQVINPSDSANVATSTSLDPDSVATRPDRIYYKYGSQCSGSGANAHQLCSVSSRRDVDTATKHTTFTYTTPTGLLSGEMPKIASVTDRRDTATSFTYSSGVTTVDANPGQGAGTHRRTYLGIDDQGRVGQLDEGDASGGGGSVIGRTYYTWDGRPDGDADVRCQSPGGGLDNNLCLVQRESGTSATPDEERSYLYNDEGGTLAEHTCLNASVSTPHAASCIVPSAAALSSTAGYSALYYMSDGTVSGPYTETVAGSGVVTPGAVRPITGKLFALSDRTQSLTPRGNESGNAADLVKFRTTYRVDNVATMAPNTFLASGNYCTTTGTASGNSGLVCGTEAPSSAAAATYAPSTTHYRYDRFGQRVSMKMPNQVAANQSNAYAYTYFTDQTAGHTDLSGSVYAGGWLKYVSDTNSRFVEFVYDPAGNVIRTYDRDATSGTSPTNYSGVGWTGTTTPAPVYAETTYGPYAGAPSTATPASAPWRYVLSEADQLGNRTTYVVDLHGNPEITRPPRGNPSTGAVTTYDVTREFADDDLLTETQQPVEASAGQHSTHTYDAFGNLTVVTDPLGHATSHVYDARNRRTHTHTGRGLASNTAVPSGCASSASAPVVGFPASPATVYCTTSTAYDMVDNAVSTTDGAAQTTTNVFDGAHRKTRTDAPGHTSPAAALRTELLYDADGNVVVACPPRQYASGAQCNRDGVGTPSYYATYTSIDNAGRVSATKKYRDTTTTSAVVTTREYDANGNETAVVNPRGIKTTYTYDVLDRKRTQVVPRTVDSTGTVTESYTTSWTYSDAGDLGAVFMPGSPSDASNITGSNQTRITAHLYDAAHRHTDTVRGLQLSGTNPSTSAWSTVRNSATTATASGNSLFNQRTRNVYDADGNIVRTYEPRAFVDGGTVTAPLVQFSVVMDYDANGRAVEQFLPRSTNGAGISDTSQCAPGTDTQARGYSSTTYVCRTKVTYDASGRPATMLMPTRTSTATNRYMEYGFTHDGLFATLTGPDPAVNGARETLKTRAYDGAGRMVTEDDALGRTTTTVYWPDGRVREVNRPATSTLSHQVRHEYDPNGNQARIVMPRTQPGSTSTVEDDATEHAYTPDNLLASTTANGSGAFGTDFDVTTYEYDSAGNTTAVKSPNANATAASNTAGTPTRHTHTADNLLLTATEPVESDGSVRRRTTHGYDPAGRKTSSGVDLVDATGTVISSTAPTPQVFTYTPLDQLKTEQARGGNACITRAYDTTGNLTLASEKSVACNVNATSRSVSATYLLDGKIASASGTTYAYDGGGNVTSRVTTNNAVTDTTTFTNNDAGLPTSMTSSLLPANTSTTFAYNSLGQTTSRTDANLQTVTWSYAADNTLSSLGITSPGGTTNDTAQFTYTYDEQYRKLTQTYTGKDASALHLTVPAVTYSYEYDPAGRVSEFASSALGSTAKSVTWDHNGNRLTYGPRTFTYRADNSILTGPEGTSNTARSHTQDPVGRLTDDGCAAYGYDGFDRLTSSTGAGGLDCGNATVTYVYDALDRQSTRTASVPGQTAATTTLFYSGLSQSVSTESLPFGNPRNDYVLDVTGAPIALKRIGTGATTQYLAEDGTGSTATVTDATGAVVCTARYDAFGSPAGNTATTPTTSCNSGSTPSTAFFRSNRKDEATGAYQLGSRTYDPQKGAFLTPDSYRNEHPEKDLSVGTDPLTANRYTYVNGDPVNMVDPDGHMLGCDDTRDCGAIQTRLAAQQHKAAVARYRKEDAEARDAIVKGLDKMNKRLEAGVGGSEAAKQAYDRVVEEGLKSDDPMIRHAAEMMKQDEGLTRLVDSTAFRNSARALAWFGFAVDIVDEAGEHSIEGAVVHAAAEAAVSAAAAWAVGLACTSATLGLGAPACLALGIGAQLAAQWLSDKVVGPVITWLADKFGGECVGRCNNVEELMVDMMPGTGQMEGTTMKTSGTCVYEPATQSYQYCDGTYTTR